MRSTILYVSTGHRIGNADHHTLCESCYRHGVSHSAVPREIKRRGCEIKHTKCTFVVLHKQDCGLKAFDVAVPRGCHPHLRLRKTWYQSTHVSAENTINVTAESKANSRVPGTDSRELIAAFL
eukprot:2156993-Rhodomonas_salina.2